MPTLDFKGKQFVYSHHHTVPFRELKVDEEKSLPATDKNANLDDNLIIHGDNLHALKALMPRYAGKVKCIYIDPPYNTGNEGWVYNDNVNSPLMKQWLKDMKPIDREDMERHDKWLCMMYPRLKLLHELLADDGVIFVSIDDNEVHHLRMMMDEVFGEENFVAQISWQRKKENSNDSKNLSVKGEYVVCYSRTNDLQLELLPISSEYIENSYYEPNNIFPKGKWRPVPIATTKGHKSGGYNYEITTPSGNKHLREWAYPEKSYKNLLAEGRIYFGKDDSGIPQRVIYAHESKGIPASNVWNEIWDEVATNKQGKKEILEILPKENFETPKPANLIKKILQLSADKSSIILDSFAGSGTTAHAVLDLNKEDGGNRKFILVECENYADSITAERVRRVIKGVPTAKDEKLKNGLGGSFTFCELGLAMEIEKMLTGESLPNYENLASYVFYTSTGQSLEKPAKSRVDFFVGETELYEIYLIYEPDLAFLRSNESALNFDKVEIIKSRSASKKTKLVFATAKFMGQKELAESGITFCQLPYAIHKIAGK